MDKHYILSDQNLPRIQLKILSMKFYYLEYRIIYSAVFTKKTFNSAEERETFIVKSNLGSRTAYICKMDYDVKEAKELVEILNYILQ